MFAQLEEHIKGNSPDVTEMIEKQIKLFDILKKIAKSVKEAKDKKT